MKKFRIGLDIDDTIINAVDTVTTLNNKIYGTSLGRGGWLSNGPEGLLRWRLQAAITVRLHANTPTAGVVRSLLFSDNYSWDHAGLYEQVVRYTTWKDIRDDIDDQSKA